MESEEDRLRRELAELDAAEAELKTRLAVVNDDKKSRRKVVGGPMLGVMIGTLKRARKESEMDGLEELEQHRRVKVERKTAWATLREYEARERALVEELHQADDLVDGRANRSSRERAENRRQAIRERVLPQLDKVRARIVDYEESMPEDAFFSECRRPSRDEPLARTRQSRENLGDVARIRSRLRDRYGGSHAGKNAPIGGGRR